ncbi:hypothetical protein BH10ACI2_BH10ACI2_09460 [soil metagenome]
MIAGFNTDIEFDGTVYHVQTEDKGVSSCQIMSLVYNRGTILASKRVSYDDLMIGNFDEKVLAERVGRQHKLICAAVKAGRINELKEMTAKSAGAVSKSKNGAKVPAEAVAVAEMPVQIAVPTAAVPTTPPPVLRPELTNPVRPVKIAPVEASPVMRPQQPIMVATSEPVMAAPSAPVTAIVADPIQISEVDTHLEIELEPVIDAVQIIEDVILPAEAVAVVSELSGRERPTNAKLSLEILGETKFKGGDRRMLNVMICRGTERKVVRDAQIMIKVLGSSFRPVIFHAKSDPNGLAKIHLQLPHFQAGRAAILIRAIAGGEEVELRRVVMQG